MADLQIEKGSGIKPNETFATDTGPTDLDGACTVTLTKPDGSAGPASGTVTHIGTGKYEFQLGQQNELIYYDVTWSGTISGQAVSKFSRVEVVGKLLYNIADLRAVKVAGGQPFTATDYPNDVVMAKRVEVTDDFEARTGWSFIPRFARETFDGAGQSSLILRKYLCQRLLSVTIDGTAQTVSDYALAETGLLQRKTGGTFSALQPRNVVVEYVYGWDRPPAAVGNVALVRTAALLLPSQFGSTATTVTTPDGATIVYDQAGQTFGGGGRRFYGIPAIDSVLSDPAYNARRGGVFA